MKIKFYICKKLIGFRKFYKINSCNPNLLIFHFLGLSLMVALR